MANGLWVKQTSGRNSLVDTTRGIALVAILLIHCSNNFLYSTPALWSAPTWLAELDNTIKTTLYFLFEGKAYAIFALLMGFTLSLQAERKTKGTKRRILWRMVLLVGFGLFNAALFSGGDPLVFYALSIIPIIAISTLPNKALIVIAVILALQPLEIANAISPFLGESYIDYYNELVSKNNGASFWNIALNNATIGTQGALTWAVETGRFGQTLALFTLGILAYRYRIFDGTKKLYLVMGSISLVMVLVIYGLNKVVSFYPLTMYSNLASSALIISIIAYLYRCCERSKAWQSLALYGKMSLTNFIGQSVICTTIFYSWGLHLTPYVGVTLSIVIGVLVFYTQLIFSKWWLNHHTKGPLESLWHRLTWIGKR